MATTRLGETRSGRRWDAEWLAFSGLLAAALCRSPGAALAASAVGSAAASAPAAPLVSPPVLPNRSSIPRRVEVDLTAAPARLGLVSGKLENLYAYNGRVPGPTLEVREGDRVIVHFHNHLPEETTVHWHGLHVPVEADGNPMDPVPPGGSYDYVFNILPGMAGTYWYHPHPCGHASRQVLRGLYGAIVIRAAADPLPATLPEKLLLLSDIRVSSRGSLIIPDTGEQGTEGNVMLVNGQIGPTVAMRSGEVQRWRVVNASVARYYRLALPGHTFLQVSSDCGLFERPVERNEILLVPAQRVEVLVRGSGTPGSRSILQSLPYDRYIPGMRPVDWDKTLDLLTVQYTAESPLRPPALPTTLRRIPALDPAKATAIHTLVYREALINGKFFNMNRVDITARLNTTEIWIIKNHDEMDHTFHMHGFAFQVLDRNGAREPFTAWQDTVNVPRNTSVRIIVEYKDYPGKRMFHCHIMDHEDYGMMGMLDVR